MKYIKTQAGQAAFKERSPLFSPRQRSAYILFDGDKTVAQVLGATAGMGVTQADVDHMVAHGLLAPAAGDNAPALAQSDPSSAAAQGGEPRSGRSEQERYQEAKLLATQLTAALGLRGFMLNMAVESASGYAELLALLPKIQSVAGLPACRELERALKG